MDRTQVLQDLTQILTELREDWDYEGQIIEGTGIFADLGFESIDAVALGSAIEDYYNQSLPFAEFLTKAGERQATDIYVRDLVDFLVAQVK
jgi:acyl carrier protein